MDTESSLIGKLDDHYFWDVDWPIMLRDSNLEWSAVKNKITNEVKKYMLE